jgi:hypothetical protein
LRIKGPPGDEHPEVRALKRKIKEAWRIIATADPLS